MTNGSKNLKKQFFLTCFDPDADLCVFARDKGYTFMTTFLEKSLSV